MQYIDGHGLDRVLFEARRLREASAPPALPTDGPSALAYRLLTGRLGEDTAVALGGSTVADRPPPLVAPHQSCAGDEYVRAVAHLGRQVAAALDHAHAQG